MTKTKQVNHTERSHALLAPSGAARWSECPGSLWLAKDEPETESSEYAAEGTEAHEWADKLLQAYKKDDGTYEVLLAELPEKFAVHVVAYVEYCIGLINKLGKRVIDYWIECKVTVSKDMKGTADFVLLFKDEKKYCLVMVDLKYGSGVEVYPEYNKQLMIYGYGATNYVDYDIDEVVMVIYQPRIEDAEPAKPFSLTYKELEKEIKKLKKKGATALKMYDGDIPPEFKAGDHCQFCPAKACCPTVINAVEKATNLAIDELSVLPNASKLTDAQILEFKKHSNALKSLCNDIDQYIINRAKFGKPIEGTKLVAGRSARSWHGEHKAIGEQLQKMGVADPYKPPTLKGITEIEKTLGKGKASPFCKLSTPALKAALADDPKPAVEFNNDSALDMLDTL